MRLEAELPDNYRPATSTDVPEGQACGNCAFFNEEDVAPDGRARCEQWGEYVDGGAYCNAWQGRAEAYEDEDEDEEMKASKPDLKLTFSADVTAADVERRTIVGRILPFGEIGNTSLGPVRFEAGAITNPSEVKLLLEHDGRKPIGKSVNFVQGTDHIVGSFRIANTTSGTDALVEASEGLRDGLSVGANILEHTVGKDGVMNVTAAELVEVSLVTTPAFAGAQVTQVAASQEAQTEENKVEEQTVEVTATEAATSTPETVEAATPEVVASAQPSTPYITAQPRDLKGLTAGGMLRAHLRAGMGDHDAQMLVNAALGEQTTVRDGGVIPVPLLREIIGVVDDTRYFINSIDRQALPDAGMSFRIPLIDTLPNVAEQANELDEVASVQSKIEDITVDVRTFAGGNKISRQLIERSDPAYFDELLRQLAARYAQATDVFALTQANPAGTAAARASDGETIYDAVAQGIADAYTVMRFTPNRLMVSPVTTGSFGYDDLLKEVDQGGRPLFAAAAPQNASGLVTQGSTNGTVAGLDLVVNPNAVNSNGLVYPGAFATFYETAGAPIRVETRYADDLSVDVSVYGYCALALKYPTAIRNITVTPPSSE